MNGRQFTIVILVQGACVALVLVCATVLAAIHTLDAQSVVVIFGTAVGLAGGVGGATAAAAASKPAAGTTHVPDDPANLAPDKPKPKK